MKHVAELLEKYHAQFWINHDAKQAAGIRHAPECYEWAQRLGRQPGMSFATETAIRAAERGLI
jgi:hypothetical protein